MWNREGRHLRKGSTEGEDLPQRQVMSYRGLGATQESGKGEVNQLSFLCVFSLT